MFVLAKTRLLFGTEVKEIQNNLDGKKLTLCGNRIVSPGDQLLL